MTDLHVLHLAHTKKCAGLVEVVVVVWEVGNEPMHINQFLRFV